MIRHISAIILSCILFTNIAAKENYIYRQISQKEGFTSTVNCIYKEKDGDVWIGSPSGLYRFNGYSLHQSENPLLKGKVHMISRDHHDNLWVLTDNHLLRRKSNEDSFSKVEVPGVTGNQAFHSIHLDGECIWFGSIGKLYRYTYSDDTIRLFCETVERPGFVFRQIDRIDNNALLCSSHNGIILINSGTGVVASSPFNTYKEVYASLVDSKGRLWLAFYNNGIEVFAKDGSLIRSFNTENSDLSNNIVLCLTENNSQIWAGTNGGGINIIDLDKNTINVLSHVSGDASSFPSHSIRSIHTDHYGGIWAGSIRDGLISISKSRMTTYGDTHIGMTEGLSNSTALCLYQEAGSDYLWIGTDGEGINRFDPRTGEFKHYTSTLQTKVISIASYSEDELALSLFADRLCLFNKKTGTIRTLKINDEDINYQIRYTGRYVSLANEKGGGLILYGNSIKRLDRATGKCTKLLCADGSGSAGSYLHIKTSDDGIWFHDNNSIYFLEHGADVLKRIGNIKDITLHCGHPDRKGNIWFATDKGLCRYSLADKSFSFITTDLFASASSVVCDRRNRVWVGTGSGLYAYLKDSGIFTMFGESDGASPNEYLSRPHMMSSTGDVYMGGVLGLLHIDSSYQIDASEDPRLTFQGLVVDQEQINVTKGKTVKLPRHSKTMNMSISVQEKDIFRHKRYKFCLSDQGTFYSKYPVLSIRQMPPPGTYNVTVSCTKRNGEWTEPTSLMRLKILHPWYQTGWFIGGCAGIIVLIFLISLASINRRKADELKMAMQEQEQVVYEEKVKMLINISHELRTPLTLIMAPLKRLTSSMDASNEHYTTLNRIYRQSRRMRDLLNMVLDLRKMEVGKNALKIEKLNYNAWLTEATDDIVNEEKDEGIEIIYNLDTNILSAETDIRKCDTVLMNTLMNAIKHSRRGDRITVSTKLTDKGMIQTSISDEGPGFDKDLDPNILFTPFYQSNNEKYGSGIGLSYSKILIEMLGGQIGAHNNEDKGATFWWEIPSKTESSSDAVDTSKAYLNELLGQSSTADIQAPESESFCTSGMRLMLVDDSTDLLDFLKEALSQDFSEIMTATSGNQALKKIHAGTLPDIIVSDVNMPDGDGFRLCSELKGNEKFSHIPIILLTARGEEQSQSDSYRMGADGFLAKPFEIETLTEAIRGQHRSKAEIRKRYFDDDQQAQSGYGSNEESFIIHLNRIIAEHMSDPDLDQQLICREMGVSRALLYNKMKAITGSGAKDYITKIRIEKAKSLIENTSLSIAEIAEMTGFSAQSYFSTAFKNYTGLTPSKYKQVNRTEA